MIECPACHLDLTGLADYLTRVPRLTSREVCTSCGALLLFTFRPAPTTTTVRELTSQEAAALALKNPVAWYLMAYQSAQIRGEPLPEDPGGRF